VASAGSRCPYGLLNDTWEYTNSWSGPLFPPNFPSGRVYAAAAPVGGSGMMMTGGLDQTGIAQSDTHVYGLNSWTNSNAPLPVGLFGHSMASDDAGANATWIVGGFTKPSMSSPSTATNTMLLWDGNVWVPQTAFGSVPARGFAQLTFDQARRQLVLFGGTDGGRVLDDLWVLQR
jgi:hypothetical protein